MKEKKLIKFIRNALKHSHLYSNDEVVYMKKEMKNLENIIKEHNKIISKGFGN
jgi:hypothetical protein